jgi:thiol-disulfide isomerase/thioredoxin
MIKNKWITLTFLLAGLGIAFFLVKRYRVPPSIDFSSIALSDLNGQQVSLKQFEGKTVFVNFWATWCPDCLREMPSIAGARKQLDSSKVVFVLVSDEPIEKIQRYVDTKGIDVMYWKSTKPFGELGIHAIPTSYLLNPHGRICMEKVGGFDWETPDFIELVQGVSKGQ